MKSSSILNLLIISLVLICVVRARPGCDETRSSEDSDVKAWFKNLGCKIKEGAEDLQESAKPWAEKIGNSAKDFGNTVAQKYDEIKHKLTDDNNASSSPPDAQSISTAVQYNSPTEKVPLAPLNGEAQPQPAATTGEQKSSTKQLDEIDPESIDNRFLLQQQLECPKGEVMDHRHMCRPKV